MILRRLFLWAIVATFVSVGVGNAAVPFDSQVVLARYALAIDALPTPKAVILDYALSQSAPAMIDEHHILYRSGVHVRDETISLGGSALRQREIHIGTRDDRYAVARLAPHADVYGFVFVRKLRQGHAVGYLYEAVPLIRQATGFVVDSMIIDARSNLPTTIRFSTISPNAHGHGEILYERAGKFWMPTKATIAATVNGKPARETISFGAYRFPNELPSGTFLSPKPLPQLSLPTF